MVADPRDKPEDDGRGRRALETVFKAQPNTRMTAEDGAALWIPGSAARPRNDDETLGSRRRLEGWLR